MFLSAKRLEERKIYHEKFIIVLNYRAILMLGVVLSLAVFSFITWPTSAQDNAGDSSVSPSAPTADGDLDTIFNPSVRSSGKVRPDHHRW